MALLIRSICVMSGAFALTSILALAGCGGDVRSNNDERRDANRPSTPRTPEPTPRSPRVPVPTVTPEPTPRGRDKGLSISRSTIGTQSFTLVTRNYDLALFVDSTFAGIKSSSHRQDYEIDRSPEFASEESEQ